MLDGVRIYHIRNVSGPHTYEVFQRGGLTVAVYVEGQLVFAAVGVCGHQNTFSRKQGRKVAVGRIEKLRDTPDVKFAKIFDLSRFGSDTEYERALTAAHILVDESKLKGKQRRMAVSSIEGTRMQRKFLEEVTGSPSGNSLAHNFRFDSKLLASSTSNFWVSGTKSGRYPTDEPNQAHPGGTVE